MKYFNSFLCLCFSLFISCGEKSENSGFSTDYVYSEADLEADSARNKADDSDLETQVSKREKRESSPLSRERSPIVEDEDGDDDPIEEQNDEDVSSENLPEDEEEPSEEDVADVDEEEEVEVDPYVVEFTIPANYDGTSMISSAASPIELKVYPGENKQEFPLYPTYWKRLVQVAIAPLFQ